MCRAHREVRREGFCFCSGRFGNAKVAGSYCKQFVAKPLSGWLAGMDAEISDAQLVWGLLTPQSGLPCEGYNINAS